MSFKPFSFGREFIRQSLDHAASYKLLPMLHNVLESLVGIVRPIDLRHGRYLVERSRTMRGWEPPMMLIATVMVLVLARNGFGLLAGNGAAILFNYFALATWVVVGLGSCSLVISDSVANLLRFRAIAVTHPRWWFELSRLVWIAFLFLALSALLLVFLSADFALLLFPLLPFLFGVFMLLGTAGYISSGLTGRPRRGRAFECVQYFYWQGVAAAISFAAIWGPAIAGFADPMTSIACLIGACAIGILILKLMERNSPRVALVGGHAQSSS